jgi:hypothetical protein
VLGEVRVADGVAPARVVLVPVGGDLDDGRDRRQLGLRRKPEVRGQPRTVRERDPEVVDLPDSGIGLSRRSNGHTCRIGGGADG